MESQAILKQGGSSVQKVVRTNPTVVESNTGVGGKFRFEIPASYGDLVQQVIKVKLKLRVDALVAPPIGVNVYKYVRLVSETGVIQTLDPVTMLARLELIKGTGLYDRIFPGIVGDEIGTSLKTGVEMFIPLWWFFSDTPGDSFTLRGRGKMWVECVVAKSLIDMGISLVGGGIPEVDYLTHELYSWFIQRDHSYISEIKPITNSYNSFEEKSVKFVSTSSNGEVKVKLNCPYEVFMVHFYVFNSLNGGSANITSVTLDGPMSQMFDIDSRMNYLLSGKESTDVFTEGVYTVKFGERRSGDFVRFSANAAPTYATVKYDTLGLLGHEVRAVCEYRSEITGDIPTLQMSGSFTVN